MFQSPGIWYTGYIEGMFDASPTAANIEIQNCETNVTRLIELIRKTEETTDIDYMGSMSEVNSLVYDLITSDHASCEAISEERALFIPKCYICKALEEIGTDSMAEKVESERVLLEAIAVSEGRLGEDHSASFHFRVKLFLLYNDWSCRMRSTGNLLARLIEVALLKSQTKSESDTLSALIQSDTFPEPEHCAWFQDVAKDPAREISSSTSSHLMSTLSIRGDSIRESPRRLMEAASAIARRMGGIVLDESNSWGPIFDSIFNLGLESADGPSYFWISTFTLAVSKKWELIFNSRYLISNAAIERGLPGSTSLKSSVERLLSGPYRLDTSAETAAPAEFPPENCGLPLAGKHTKFDDITKLEGPLTNLEQLRVVLAEVALREIERSCDPGALDILQYTLRAVNVYDTICDAARIGCSYFITLFGKNFGNFTFGSYYPWKDILNLEDEFGKFGFSQVPLAIAAEGGHQRCVEALINVGADVDGEDDSEVGKRPIELAADAGHGDIVRLLIENGATSDHERVLMCIVNSSDQEFHECWVERSLSHNDWQSLLKMVMLCGEKEEYELYDILSERLRTNFRRLENESGKPAIQALDSDLGFYSALDEVLDLTDDNDRGLELLLDTLTGVHIEQQARPILRTLLDEFEIAKNEAIQVDESSGSPILHALVCRNAPNALGVFLGLGPNINLTDVHDNTALHIAASRNRIACARLLLQSGTNVHAENADGETALQICIRKEHAAVAEEIMMISFASTSYDGDSRMI
jgi:ankyrin repeat protein